MFMMNRYSLMQPGWLALHVIGIGAAVWLGKTWGENTRGEDTWRGNTRVDNT